MVITKRTVDSFRRLKDEIEKILPDTEDGVSILCGLEAHYEELCDIHGTITDHQKKVWERKKLRSQIEKLKGQG